MEIVSAIIVAAGSGKRMGAPIPKQFIKINGKSVLQHTIDKFLATSIFNEIIIVLSEDYLSFVQEIKSDKPEVRIQACLGGPERFHSVKNALNLIDKQCNYVFIHDAVRPYCSTHFLQSCYTAARQNGCAVPVVSIKDSVREVNKTGQSKIVDREKLRSVQTPQVFDYQKILAAYQSDYTHQFTDDASVFEQAGHAIHLITGEFENTKITTPEDLAIAKIRLPDSNA